MTAPDKKWPKHRRSGKPLLREVYADPGQNGFYYREKHFDSVMRYIAEPDVNALVAATYEDARKQIEKLGFTAQFLTDRIPNDAQAALDAIKAQVREEARRVKPLVWMECGENQFEQDADFVDTTQTYQIQEGVFWYGAEVDGTPCGSNEAAKAAAQADYERRILSALMDTQTEGEG